MDSSLLAVAGSCRGAPTSDDVGDDPSNKDNGNPNAPALEGVALAVDGVLVKDLEEDGTRSDQAVEDTDNNTDHGQQRPSEKQKQTLWAKSTEEVSVIHSQLMDLQQLQAFRTWRSSFRMPVR
jgi:hypothetical protein